MPPFWEAKSRPHPFVLGHTRSGWTRSRGLFGHRKTQTDSKPDYRSAEEIAGALQAVEDGIEAMESAGPDGTPDWKWRLAMAESYARLLRKALEKFEHG